MRVLQLTLLAGLVTLASPLAQAQAPDTLSPAQRSALARLGAGQRVRIVTGANEFMEGSVITTSPNLLKLRTAESVVDIPASAVDSLWVRGGSHAGKGALIGAVPGVLVLGATFVYSRTAPASETRDWNSFGGAIIGLMLLGGGTAIGAIIGSHTPKWQRQVPRPPQGGGQPIADSRERFVEGPVLVLPLEGQSYYVDLAYSASIDPQSTVYRILHASDAWGVLDVTGGALVVRGSNGRIDRVVVPAPPTAGVLEGDGWKLRLNPGWQLVPGQRNGDVTVAKR